MPGRTRSKRIPPISKLRRQPCLCRQRKFDLVTAFEVIEHLAAWRDLLSEARRVLAPGGLFLVSTPNRLYYADSRRLDGPNPYHVHEFEFEEFDAALREFFLKSQSSSRIALKLSRFMDLPRPRA